MKPFLLLVILFGCSTVERGVQVQMVIVEIKSMEPYYRNGEEAGCKIDWWDDLNNVLYTSFSKAPEYCDNYLIGTKYRLLIHK